MPWKSVLAGVIKGKVPIDGYLQSSRALINHAEFSNGFGVVSLIGPNCEGECHHSDQVFVNRQKNLVPE